MATYEFSIQEVKKDFSRLRAVIEEGGQSETELYDSRGGGLDCYGAEDQYLITVSVFNPARDSLGQYYRVSTLPLDIRRKQVDFFAGLYSGMRSEFLAPEDAIRFLKAYVEGRVEESNFFLRDINSECGIHEHEYAIRNHTAQELVSKLFGLDRAFLKLISSPDVYLHIYSDSHNDSPFYIIELRSTDAAGQPRFEIIGKGGELDAHGPPAGEKVLRIPIGRRLVRESEMLDPEDAQRILESFHQGRDAVPGYYKRDYTLERIAFGGRLPSKSSST